MPSVLERLREALAPNYTVERELATGGMGTVYLARDERLGRPLAIKILRPELSTAVALERFEREAQYLAQLNHPNILPVHFAGESNGLVYYVMDYVEGATLDRRIRQGPLSLEETISLGRGLLSALVAAHAKGVIHRDIKPANVFLSHGRPMLGDFGIACTVNPDDTALTSPGASIGTPLYMPPEQAAGSPVTAQSDIYAIGLVLYEACTGRRWPRLAKPDQVDWSDVPEPLIEPLTTALQWLPQDRWPDARSFAQALAQAQAIRGMRWSLLLLPLAIAGVLLAWWSWPQPEPAPSSLAVYPFEVVGLTDTALGDQLARVTASHIETWPGVTVTPIRTTFREWRASTLPPTERLDQVTARIGAEYGVSGVVRPSHRGWEVQLSAVDSAGHRVLDTIVRGDPEDRLGLGDAISAQLLQKVFPRSKPLYRSGGALAGVSPRAVREFLFGEDASGRDAWLTAERHYLKAFELDSTFVLAVWRLANARRWMPLRPEAPLPEGFLSLYHAHAGKLPRVDRLLIEAQFAPGGEPRFRLYDTALAVAPRDAYPALYYGDELFHRGPLSGRGLDEAIAILRKAVALDSLLAPAHEHLAWALIRAGEKDGARLSLDALHRSAGNAKESEIYLPALLELAFGLRFAGNSTPLKSTSLQSPLELALAARGALSFGMPAVEYALGARLASLPAAPAALHGSGQIAQGVASMALGRPVTALRHFDSAAVLLPERLESRIQSAEWRVIPAAFGFPGIPDAEIESGRRELVRLTADTSIGRRAAWALAVDALQRGDAAAAAPWRKQVASGDTIDGPLDLLLRAMAEATAGRYAAALELSRPALSYDSAGRAGDPFFRAALHLARGNWYAASNQPSSADASWLWYENLDVVGWPSTVAQAAEVDWAFSSHARWRRGKLADSHSRPVHACRMMTQAADAWRGAEASIEPLRAEARTVIGRCP
ncbi:MAG TPA: protein kinase [Gemmatimonadales bacterium]|nr:protein kinase [Gemmatimonadales bacterium]